MHVFRVSAVCIVHYFLTAVFANEGHESDTKIHNNDLAKYTELDGLQDWTHKFWHNNDVDRDQYTGYTETRDVTDGKSRVKSRRRRDLDDTRTRDNRRRPYRRHQSRFATTMEPPQPEPYPQPYQPEPESYGSLENSRDLPPRRRADEPRRAGNEESERYQPPSNAGSQEHDKIAFGSNEMDELSLYGNYSDDNATDWSGSDGTCRPCEMRESRRQLRISMIKEQLLSKLKMTKAPTISHTRNLTLIPIPWPDQDGADEDRDERENDGDFTNYIFGTPPPQLDYIREHSAEVMDERNLVYFSLGSDVLGATLQKAHLMLYLRKAHVSDDAYAYIHIYKLSNDSTGRITKPSQPNHRHQFFLTREETGKWYNISFRDISEDWKKRPADNFGLYIEALNFRTGRNLVVIKAEEQADGDFIPFLHVDMIDRKSERHRRHSEGMDCSERSRETLCCRYELMVNFDDFGPEWEWIIQPRQYSAFYCAGECHLALAGSPHSYLNSLNQDPEGGGGPCCTPVKMSSMSMLYYDETTDINSRIISDMVVDRCGCN